MCRTRLRQRTSAAEPAPILLCMGLFSRFSVPALPCTAEEAPHRVLAAAIQAQISRSPFKLACPFLPTMMWSCTEMPSGVAMSTIALVIRMSACDGVGSPEGWLCRIGLFAVSI